MNTIDTTSRLAPAPAAQSSANTLDQAAFLRLMTSQLTMQDPFNPMDNTQMVAQMAQFSQVAGIGEMNQTLRTIAAGFGNRLDDAASWIGRSMLVVSDVAVPQQNGSYAGEVHLGGDADQVTISIVDESGAVVHSQDAGAKGRGSFAFSWDGKDGDEAASGPLKIVVSAKKGGAPIETATATWAPVLGIQSPANAGAAQLVTWLGLLVPEDAIRLA